MARAGMADLIARVRQLTNAGSADYSVNGVSYWTGDQIEALLDQVRVEVFDETLHPLLQYNSDGTAEYTEYRSAYTWYEQTTGGTVGFFLRDSSGARIGTADYSVDYASGRITFGVNQAGSVRYLTGRSYDVYAAAAMVWEAKAASVADRYSFEADGARFDMSKLIAQYEQMARNMWARSITAGGLTPIRLERSDVHAARW